MKHLHLIAVSAFFFACSGERSEATDDSCSLDGEGHLEIMAISPTEHDPHLTTGSVRCTNGVEKLFNKRSLIFEHGPVSFHISMAASDIDIGERTAGPSQPEDGEIYIRMVTTHDGYRRSYNTLDVSEGAFEIAANGNNSGDRFELRITDAKLWGRCSASDLDDVQCDPVSIFVDATVNATYR